MHDMLDRIHQPGASGENSIFNDENVHHKLEIVLPSKWAVCDGITFQQECLMYLPSSFILIRFSMVWYEAKNSIDPMIVATRSNRFMVLSSYMIVACWYASIYEAIR